MRYFAGFAAIALLTGCGGGTESGAPNSEETEETEDNGDSLQSEPDAYEMPYGLGLAPNTRLVDGTSYKIGTITESRASLATTGDGKAALDYYETELTKDGWEVYSRSSNPEKPSFAAKKDDLRIQASLFGGSDLKDGETSVQLTAKYEE